MMSIKWRYCHPNFIHTKRFSDQEKRIVIESDVKGLMRKYIKTMRENEELKKQVEKLEG